MEIAESKDGEVTVLAPKGSLNTQTSPKLEQKLVAILGEKGRLIVIDFKGVDYLSSAALRVLLMIARRLARAHGRLVLCGMSEDLKKVFSISGFDRDFTILAARGEAVALAAQTPPPPPGAEPEAKGAKVKAAKKEEPPAEAAKPAAPVWPFPAAAPAAPPAREEPPPPPAPAAGSGSEALALTVARILATGEDSAPWASWSDAPKAQAKRESVAAVLAKGL